MEKFDQFLFSPCSISFEFSNGSSFSFRFSFSEIDFWFGIDFRIFLFEDFCYFQKVCYSLLVNFPIFYIIFNYYYPIFKNIFFFCILLSFSQITQFHFSLFASFPFTKHAKEKEEKDNSTAFSYLPDDLKIQKEEISKFIVHFHHFFHFIQKIQF